MQCPQCRGYELEPRELEPGLLAGVCPKCDGALISLMYYRYWLDNEELRYGRLIVTPLIVASSVFFGLSLWGSDRTLPARSMALVALAVFNILILHYLHFNAKVNEFYEALH